MVVLGVVMVCVIFKVLFIVVVWCQYMGWRRYCLNNIVVLVESTDVVRPARLTLEDLGTT